MPPGLYSCILGFGIGAAAKPKGSTALCASYKNIESNFLAKSMAESKFFTPCIGTQALASGLKPSM